MKRTCAVLAARSISTAIVVLVVYWSI